jgi:hypothetical protein
VTPFLLNKDPNAPLNVVFDCGFRSAPTNANAQRLAAIIKRDYPPATKLDADEIEVATWILSTTRTVNFIGTPETSDQIGSFKTFWNWFWDEAIIKGASYFHPDGHYINVGFVMDESILVQIWPRFVSQVSMNIQEVWAAYFFAAQDIFPARAEILPESMLTPEQRKDPDFLAAASKPVRKRAAVRNGKRMRTQNWT